MVDLLPRHVGAGQDLRSGIHSGLGGRREELRDYESPLLGCLLFADCQVGSLTVAGGPRVKREEQ